MNQPAAPVTMPKAAQQLIDDAKADGFTVKVRHDAHGVDIWVERGESNASFMWVAGEFYSTPLRGERLGFRTTAGTPGVRFDHSMTYSPYRGHTYHKSIRQARLYVGIPTV